MHNQDQLVQIATALPGAIQERAEALDQIQARLDHLRKWSCNGTEYWRNKNHATREPKLYINHSIDQACPMHGTPEPGERLRIYIGSDPERQAEARQWMENEKERQAVQKQVDQLTWALRHLDRRMEELFRSVGYTYPENGGQPEPDTDWSPDRARCRW